MSENAPLSPEEAAAMLDAIEHRLRNYDRQLMLLAVAVLALAATVGLLQWKLARGD